MFGPLRERIETAVEKVEGMLVGFPFQFDLILFHFQKGILRSVYVDEKQLKIGYAGVWCPNG